MSHTSGLTWQSKACLGSSFLDHHGRAPLPSFLYPLLFVPPIWHWSYFVFLVALSECMLSPLLGHDLATCSLGSGSKGLNTSLFCLATQIVCHFLAEMRKSYEYLPTLTTQIVSQSSLDLFFPPDFSHRELLWIHLFNHEGLLSLLSLSRFQTPSSSAWNATFSLVISLPHTSLPLSAQALASGKLTYASMAPSVYVVLNKPHKCLLL